MSDCADLMQEFASACADFLNDLARDLGLGTRHFYKVDPRTGCLRWTLRVDFGAFQVEDFVAVELAPGGEVRA